MSWMWRQKCERMNCPVMIYDLCFQVKICKLWILCAIFEVTQPHFPPSKPQIVSWSHIQLHISSTEPVPQPAWIVWGIRNSLETKAKLNSALPAAYFPLLGFLTSQHFINTAVGLLARKRKKRWSDEHLSGCQARKAAGELPALPLTPARPGMLLCEWWEPHLKFNIPRAQRSVLIPSPREPSTTYAPLVVTHELIVVNQMMGDLMFGVGTGNTSSSTQILPSISVLWSEFTLAVMTNDWWGCGLGLLGALVNEHWPGHNPYFWLVYSCDKWPRAQTSSFSIFRHSAVAHCTSFFFANVGILFEKLAEESSNNRSIIERMFDKGCNQLYWYNRKEWRSSWQELCIPRVGSWSLIAIYLTLEPNPILSSFSYEDIKITQFPGFEYFMAHEYFSLRFSRLTNHGLFRSILYKSTFPPQQYFSFSWKNFFQEKT